MTIHGSVVEVNLDVLVELGPSAEPLEFRLDGRDAIVGRDGTCDIVLDEARVSSRHGIFRLRGGTWTYMDLSSTNGSALISGGAGELVPLAAGHETPVSPGDVVVLAASDEPIRLRLDAGAAAPYEANPDARSTVLAKSPLVDLMTSRVDAVLRLAAEATCAETAEDLAAVTLEFLRRMTPQLQDHGVLLVGAGLAVEVGATIPSEHRQRARRSAEVVLLGGVDDDGTTILVPLDAGGAWHGMLAAWSDAPRSGPPLADLLAKLGLAGSLLALAVQALVTRRKGAEAQKAMEAEIARLRRDGRAVKPLGSDPRFMAALETCRNLGRSELPMLLLGETGSGKEVLARTAHASSARAEGPFVAINCAAIPDELLESELFGHARGAFTGATRDHRGVFETADGGTLFLDEIGEMPARMQAKLLRVLEDGEVRRVGSERSARVDVRVVSATHRDLEALADEGRFRKDLLYRLNTATIRIPPLRERGDDVIVLAHHFLDEFSRESGDKRIAGFTAAALEVLTTHPFEGNIRELRNEIARAVVLTQPGQAIAPAAFSERLSSLHRGPVAGDDGAVGVVGATLAEQVERTERAAVKAALAASDGNMTRAAEMLGLSRSGLYRLMERVGLERG